MGNNLVIGSTSQLAHYFPDDYIKISSRNIDMNYLKMNKWDSVYITFAEQRVHMNDIDYITPNYIYTMEVINSLIDNSNKIVIYTTCELWNKYKGAVYINSEPEYEYNNDYVKSKLMLRNKIYELRNIDKKWFKIVIIHPFYFNSTLRKDGFLFNKIFDSIINNKKIEIGNTNFERDMVHTKYIAEKSISATKDEMIGSGMLFNINKFIKDLYNAFNMDYNFYVKENINIKDNHSKKSYYSKQEKIYTYDMLLKDTIDDIKKIKINTMVGEKIEEIIKNKVTNILNDSKNINMPDNIIETDNIGEVIEKLSILQYGI